MIFGLTLLAIALSILLLAPEIRRRMFSFLWPTSTPTSDKNQAGANIYNEEQLGDATSEKSQVGNETGQIKTQDKSSPKPEEIAEETTPKAQPVANGHLPSVPSFTLNTGEDEDSEDDTDNMPPPSFPAMNSAQRASAPPTFRKPPALKPLNGAPTASQLMPPPRLPQALRTPPSAAANLRSPQGPLPNRGPPVVGGLGVPQASQVKTPNPRQKVVLKPGHSPLDWATLQKSHINLSGVDRLVRVTPSMLKEKNGRKGKPAWSSYQGKVYNITPYLPFHPGGEGELRRVAGKDGEKLFVEVHPWVNWDNMLDGCLVGIMVTENDARSEEQSCLDDMD
ncbi:putative MFS-type transporter [Venturia nashicola]|uniref:Putative MFS-type transporter n=1 Tax=Venturia nashicola TaxID=86259 RepID=A0A4Z1P7E1_9PEZI|nr:putative MFS-type transporter [Venturia nashicola]TLD35545.1 putative MFS-type transporter [Venturia nashicola]